MADSGKMTCCVCGKTFEWEKKDGRYILMKKRFSLFVSQDKTEKILFVTCPHCGTKQEVKNEVYKEV